MTDALSLPAIFFLWPPPWVYRLLSETDWNYWFWLGAKVLFWWSVVSVVFVVVVWRRLAKYLDDVNDDE